MNRQSRSGSAWERFARDSSPLAFLFLAISVLAVALSLFHIAAYLRVATVRMQFPFALEWMEGGSLVQVLRLVSGDPLYVRPSFDFVPQIYPPLYFYVSTLSSLLLGPGFLSLRLVSFASSLVIMIILGVAVHRISHSVLAGIMAAGIFAATYMVSGSWFDVARVDSLGLALFLVAVLLLLIDRPIASAVGGLALALTCLTKQTYIIPSVFLGLYVLVHPRRNAMIFLGVWLVTLALLSAYLNHISHGWYLYYVVDLPTRHSLPASIPSLLKAIREFIVDDIFSAFPLGIAIAISYLFLAFAGPASFPAQAQSETAKRDWPRINITIASLLALAALAGAAGAVHLLGLPSDLDGGVVGRYSIARLVLVCGQILLAAGAVVGSVLLTKHPALGTRVASRLIENPRTIPRAIFAGAAAVAVGIVAMSKLSPGLMEHVGKPHIERLMPYLAETLILLSVLAIAWLMVWGKHRRLPWLAALVAAGLVATSLLGRMNPGGYANVLMPAFAGIAILVGLGVGELAGLPSGHTRGSVHPISVIAVLAASGQLVSMASPLSAPLPSQYDVKAGTTLVRRLRECPSNVYIPFHTYLSLMAGSPGHAGWIETQEIRGLFGGGPDAIWEELSQQMATALESPRFSGIVSDFRLSDESIPAGYELVGTVFGDDSVFWPATGWRIRPQFIYMRVGPGECDLRVD